MNNIVLVHGAFVDGSGWEGVYKILRRDGYSVSIVQNPTISLEDDVAVTKRTLAAQDGPTILVGHSYAGAVITEAGNHPKVAGLAYIAAFAPDKGESVATLNKHTAPGAAVSPILAPQDGYLFQDKAKFPASFAADVDAEKAAFWADSQVPWGVAASRDYPLERLGWESEFQTSHELTGMYGPPLRRKRIVRMSQVGLRKCIRPLLEWITPGQDGMRCALLPISYSVFRDFFRLRV